MILAFLRGLPLRAVLLVAGAVVVVAGLVVVAGVVWAGRSAADVTVSASTTASGTDATSAWRADPASTGAGSSSVLWSSDGETDGAWLQVAFSSARPVDRIRIDGAVSADLRPASVLVDFDGGAAVMVTADADGLVDVTFPARTATKVALRFVDAASGATAIGVHSFRVDDTGSAVRSATTSTWTSSTGSADALHDGSVSDGSFGADWESGGAGAWVQEDWDTPQPVSAITVVGGADLTASPVGGTLVFSDGSTVAIRGIGPLRDTTIAFPLRMVSSARLTLDDGVTSLAEVQFSFAGQTPPVVPDASALPALQLAGGSCDDAAVPEGAPLDRLTLVCPETGSMVADQQTLVISAPPGTLATAVVGVTGGSSGVIVGRGQADADGRLAIPLAVDLLPDGPFGLRVDAVGLLPLRLSLVRPGQTLSDPSPTIPDGMTLQFDDEFNSPLSVSETGAGTRYTAIRPSADGNNEFGDAIFPDPALGLNTLQTTNGVLRIRAQPAGDVPDDRGWGRTNVGGMLSAMRVDGTGFAAQYGYYEARILAPGENGTWPAFWMLDTGSVVSATDDFGEIDAVELYGHDVTTGCQAVHNWSRTNGDKSDVKCGDIIPDVQDLSLEWHVFGARVLPGRVDFYVDGHFVRSSARLDTHASPFYPMLNLALGGGWPIDLSSTGGVADLYVDWIRVYT